MLKLKEGFVMRKIAGETVVLPTGDKLDLNMMITLNDTAVFLWERLLQGTTREELIAALLKQYDVEESRGTSAVDAFLKRLREHQFLEE